MKKISLLLIYLTSILLSYADISAFNITLPNDTTQVYRNNDFQQRLNAAQELIWILPSNTIENAFSNCVWREIIELVIEHFNTIGLDNKRVYLPFVHVGPDQMYNYAPGKLANVKNQILNITRMNLYKSSSLIVIPELSYKFYTPCLSLLLVDVYQNKSYSVYIKLTTTKNKAYLSQNYKSTLPKSYTHNSDYEYIRPGYTTNWTEEIFKDYAKKDKLKPFEGIYQIENQRYFVKKHEHLYYLVACGKAHLYLEGDIKGILTPTAMPNVFLGGWNDGSQEDPYKNSTYAFTDIGVEFQSGTLRRMLIKVWPTADDELSNSSNTWTGTAWSLKNGYIVTNHHVIEDAKSIKINVGDKKYDALVKAVDKTNDLAILYVEELKDCSVPYAVKQSLCAVGEKCFVLGYPMSNELGKEIKLTDGIISSRVGYQDNVSLYQISAPVQPGNSGCPMFDEKGNVAGVINSGVPSADNVGYAIKLSYLRTLLENYDWVNLLPDGKEVESLGTLTEKVNLIKEYVYLVECSN